MKEKFIKSTIVLVIGGLITKILGMVIRVVMTRIVGATGIGLYMLVMPTFSLFMTIATLSLPVAISKVVAEDKRNNKNVIFSVAILASLFNIFIVILLILLAPLIAGVFLKNEELSLPIIACSLTLPFITLSSIVRGYFFGKQRMIPHVVSNIFEQIVRIAAMFLIIPKLIKYGMIYAISGLIIINVISEIASILILFFFLPKHFKIKKSDFKLEHDTICDVGAVAIPTTMGRLVSSIGSFLEPIILTFVLFRIGYNNSYVTNEYGIINGYVLPMVTMPSFLTGAISSALLPVISKSYAEGKIKYVKTKIKQAIGLSLAIGVPVTLLIFFFPDLCLSILFGDASGTDYLRVASLIYFISYIGNPLASALQAMNKSKVVMISNTIAIVIKVVFLYIFTYLDIGMYSLLFSSFLAIIYMTIHQIIALRKIKN